MFVGREGGIEPFTPPTTNNTHQKNEFGLYHENLSVPPL